MVCDWLCGPTGRGTKGLRSVTVEVHVARLCPGIECCSVPGEIVLDATRTRACRRASACVGAVNLEIVSSSAVEIAAP